MYREDDLHCTERTISAFMGSMLIWFMASHRYLALLSSEVATKVYMLRLSRPDVVYEKSIWIEENVYKFIFFSLRTFY